MRLTSRTDLRGFERSLDTIADRFERVVAPRVVRELVDVAETAAGREVAKVYNLRSTVLQPYTERRVSGIEGVITVRGRGFPLSLFDPIQTREGITVRVKGKRFLIPHAFLIVGANRRVFLRGSYGGKGLTVRYGTFGSFVRGRSKRVTRPRARRTELPINQLYTLSPPAAFSNPEVTDAMMRRIEDRAPAILKREMRAALLGFTR